MSVVTNELFFNLFKKTRWLLDIVVISIAVYFIAESVILFVEHRLNVNSVSIAKKTNIQTNKRKKSDRMYAFSYFNPIITRDLFGSVIDKKAAKQQKPKKIVVDNIPISQRLGLKLLGTIVGNPDKLSRAIIYNSRSGKYVLLKLGDKIGNAKLEKVLRDQVILNVGGKRERLVVKSESYQKNFKGRIDRIKSISSSQGIVKSSSGDVYTLSRDELNKAFDNLPSLLSGATAIPYRRGNIKGFLLRDVRPNSIYSKVGLRRGDIVVSVNNHALQNTSQLMQLYNDVRNQSEIKMKIVRHNRERVLTYYLE